MDAEGADGRRCVPAAPPPRRRRIWHGPCIAGIMTPVRRFILVAAVLVTVAALAAAAAVRVRPETARWSGWLGLAGALAVLVWGWAALAAARRHLSRGDALAATDSAGGRSADGAVPATTVSVTVGRGEAERATLLCDTLAASPAPDGLGAPGEAERQAAAIIRQIERAGCDRRAGDRPAAPLSPWDRLRRRHGSRRNPD